MEESILKTIKKILGLAPDYTPFDLDVLTHINSTFTILSQLGIGPDGGFSITGEDEKWSDFGVPNDQLNLVRSYIAIKVRLLFDPPATSFMIKLMEEQAEEFEVRLNILRENAA